MREREGGKRFEQRKKLLYAITTAFIQSYAYSRAIVLQLNSLFAAVSAHCSDIASVWNMDAEIVHTANSDSVIN